MVDVVSADTGARSLRSLSVWGENTMLENKQVLLKF